MDDAVCHRCQFWRYVGLAPHKTTNEIGAIGVCRAPSLAKQPVMRFTHENSSCDEFDEWEGS